MKSLIVISTWQKLFIGASKLSRNFPGAICGVRDSSSADSPGFFYIVLD